jgi:glycine dehydrogenase
MLRVVGFDSLDKFSQANVPTNIQMKKLLDLAPAIGESEAMAKIRTIASKNKIFRSFIGMGYSGTITPPVIQRNILENPGWYTSYTPYQAEISQGRLESLLNFQTMICDLTGLDVSNASLLDEPTAAAEAMNLCWSVAKRKRSTFYVADDTHPQTIALIKSRGEARGIKVVVGPWEKLDFNNSDICGVLLQYPNTEGTIHDFTAYVEQVHKMGALVVCATDLLSLALLKPPGEFGADVALGSAQRFGVPMGYGGPHAAFFAVKDKYKRSMPGRLIGVSKDSAGNPAYRMALQTREQHIRRETATSNVCTAQALLSNMAAMYAVYHGPEGIKNIAERVHLNTVLLANGLKAMGLEVPTKTFFDTIRVNLPNKKKELLDNLAKRKINIRSLNDRAVSVSLDETVTEKDLTVRSSFSLLSFFHLSIFYFLFCCNVAPN